MFNKKTTGYISELDKFLAQFDKTHQTSASQQREIDKHQRVFKLRDQTHKAKPKSSLWKNF